MEECKSKYLPTAVLPWERRRVYIAGGQPGNIGGAIALELAGRGVRSVVQSNYSVGADLWLAEFGKFDTLILCNAETWLDWIEDQEDDKIDSVIDNSLTESIKATSHFVQATLENIGVRKHIVFIGSMAANAVLNGSAPYCAAKAGLQHFAKCVAWELAPKGYDVFCVEPSNTQDTPMTRATIEGLARYRGISRDEAREYWGAVLPRDEWLQKSDIGEVVADLVSGRWSYASGTNIRLAGGQR
jgi:NAD(P)-dependent dehydrogenase (short-subunit alcohol dehydrogenase family)